MSGPAGGGWNDLLPTPTEDSMKVLVLWARPGATNLGVQALAEGTRALALRAFPNADVRCHGTGAPDVEGNDGPVNLLRHTHVLARALRSDREFKGWVRSFDLILDTRAGDSFADIYGLDGLAKMTLMSELAHAWGVPVVLTPQTVGPFVSRRARLLARRTLRNAGLIMTRDRQSSEVVRDLGFKTDVVASDVAFALDGVDAATQSRDVLLNVSGLLWSPNPHVDNERYRAAVVELFGTLKDAGREVSLLGHVVHEHERPGDNDSFAMSELSRVLGGAPEIIRPNGLLDVRRTIASATAVVGSRMHACLNAISLGVPAVPLGYSDKFSPLMADLGLADITVDLRRSARVSTDVMTVLERPNLAEATAVAGQVARQRLDIAVEALRRFAN